MTRFSWCHPEPSPNIKVDAVDWIENEKQHELCIIHFEWNGKQIECDCPNHATGTKNSNHSSNPVKGAAVRTGVNGSVEKLRGKQSPGMSRRAGNRGKSNAVKSLPMLVSQGS
jgi:hypothetical protein